MNDLVAPNVFVALEGCDGVGKSSIRNVLHECFLTAGRACTMLGQHAFLDPRTTRVIVNVREQRHRYDARDVADAYFRDKRLHSQWNVLPALERASVIADRSFISDAVYQDVLYDIPAEDTLERHSSAATLLPDLVVYVALDPDEAYERVVRRGKGMRHYERPADLRRITAAYDRVFVQRPAAWMPPVITFVNDVPNWRERVNEELAPAVLAFSPERSRR